MEQLREKITSLISEAGGVWGIVIENLNNDKKIAINENELFAAQSIIKVPIMAAVFAAYEKKKLSLSQLVPLKREDIVGGAGVLQHMSAGLEFTIYDLITLMIIQSDNTATNMLIDIVGFEEIEKVMEYGGMTNSCFRKKLMIYPDTDVDVENYISAADIHVFYKKLATGKMISGYSSKQMIEILKKQQVRNAIPFFLPANGNPIVGAAPEWELANKTGWDDEYQHDVGILYVRDSSVIITALSKKVNAVKSLHAIASIGKAVYEYVTK